MPRRLLQGRAIKVSSNKTVIVLVARRVMHKKYKKYITTTKKYHAHDPDNKIKIGEDVNIIESKPISKLKKWLVKYN
jgi:small subunit ribosomal protein S17